MKIVLDTCALIWWSLDPNCLSESAKNLCDLMAIERNGLVTSIIAFVKKVSYYVRRGSKTTPLQGS